MKKILVFTFVFIAFNVLNAQIITTYAGNGVGANTGVGGYSGDYGPATAAELTTPSSIAIDPLTGNLFIADAGNNVIRMVDKNTGTITTFAGTGTPVYSGDGGPLSLAGFNGLSTILFDATGNMYIGDYSNHRIRYIDRATNQLSTIAGNGNSNYSGDGGQATSAGLWLTYLALDGSGGLYAVDDQNGVVRKIDIATGIITKVVGTVNSIGYNGDGGPATAAKLDAPTAIAFDNANNMYIADRGNFCIRKVNPSGDISTIYGNQSNGCSYTGDGGQASGATFCSPTGLTFDASYSNLYITDAGNDNVRVVNLPSGIITPFAGFNQFYNNTGFPMGYSGDDSLAVQATMNQPTQTVFDALGNAFIADQQNNVIRKVCTQTDSITGFVKDTLGNPVTSGKVYAFKNQWVHPGFLDTIGSVNIASNGYYAFSNVIGNNYLLQAQANTTTYPTAIPTYLSNKPNAYQWDSASVVQNTPCGASNNTGNNIHIIQTHISNGSGLISGYITKVAAFGHRLANNGNNQVMGSPLKGIDVKLGKNPGGGCAARTTTDPNGYYQFTNVNADTYKIYVDIPNFGMDSALSVTINGAQTIANNNYYVDSVRIHVDTTQYILGIKQMENNYNQVTVYPSPTNGIITVQSSADINNMAVYNTIGDLVMQVKTTNKQEQINLSTLPNGVYFINISSGGISSVKKVVINR